MRRKGESRDWENNDSSKTISAFFFHHSCFSSNQVREAFFHFSELPDAEPEEEGGDDKAEAESGPVDGGLAAEEAPAEAIDDADHGVERIKQTPLFWDDVGAEADWGDVETELNDEGNDEAEIPVFDIQGCEPEAGPEGGEKGDEDEDGQKQDLPAGKELIPDHHADKNDKTDQKIDECDYHGGSGNDKPGKIDLADEVGVIDQTARSFREGGRKKGPRQHAGEDHESVRSRSFSGEFGHFTEDDGENDHRQKWPDQRPSDANDRLFVPDGNIAPSQYPKQLPVMPKITPIIFFGTAGFKNGHHRDVEKLKLRKLKAEI
jgi:hypothetical protein